MASIAQKNIKTKPEFQGRFFAKIQRDDVLERLMEMSNDSLKLEEMKQCK